MKIALVSFFDSERFDEYPITHSLGAMRLGAHAQMVHPDWTVRLRAFDERGFSATAAASALHAEGFDVVGVPAYIWTLERSRNLAEQLCNSLHPPLVICGGPETRTMDHTRWPAEAVHVLGQGEDALVWLCERRVADPQFCGQSLEDGCDRPVYSLRLDRVRSYRYAIPDRGNRSLPLGTPLFSPEFNTMLEGDPIETDFAWYETARGCIYECSFCGHNTLPFFATFDMDFVRSEIRNLHNRGIRRIFMIDPILGGKAARGKEVLRAFQSLAPEISLTAYMRPEFLDQEFVDVLVESNIFELLMGLQTTNPNVPKHVRGNQFEKIMRFVPHLTARGVPWRAELIVGLPGDDMPGLRESLRFTIDELRPWSVHAYRLTAIPETRLFGLLGRVDDELWIKADDLLRVTSASSFDERELRDMLIYAGAITSLHSQLRERDGAAPTFDVLDGEVKAGLADPSLATLVGPAFMTMSHSDGHQAWHAIWAATVGSPA